MLIIGEVLFRFGRIIIKDGPSWNLRSIVNTLDTSSSPKRIEIFTMDLSTLYESARSTSQVFYFRDRSSERHLIPSLFSGVAIVLVKP